MVKNSSATKTEGKADKRDERKRGERVVGKTEWFMRIRADECTERERKMCS
jgi:hypothetical protein